MFFQEEKVLPNLFESKASADTSDNSNSSNSSNSNSSNSNNNSNGNNNTIKIKPTKPIVIWVDNWEKAAQNNALLNAWQLVDKLEIIKLNSLQQLQFYFQLYSKKLKQYLLHDSLRVVTNQTRPGDGYYLIFNY